MADGELVELQHVHDAHLGHRAAKQLGPLVHTRRWGRKHTNKNVTDRSYDSQLNMLGLHLICVNVQDTPTSRPPFEPPFMVSLDEDVYPSLMRYSAAHWKSVKQFCLLASMPAEEKTNLNEQFVLILLQKYTRYMDVPSQRDLNSECL